MAEGDRATVDIEPVHVGDRAAATMTASAMITFLSGERADAGHGISRETVSARHPGSGEHGRTARLQADFSAHEAAPPACAAVGLLGYVFTRERGTLVLRARSHSPSAFACASSRRVEVAPVPSSPRMRKLTAPRWGNS
jgi:hypothetical protein